MLIHRYERCRMKFAHYSNHLTFLVHCIKNSVVPKDLRVKPPVCTKGALTAAETASLHFMCERMHLTRTVKKTIETEVDFTLAQIQSTFMKLTKLGSPSTSTTVATESLRSARPVNSPRSKT